MARPEWVEVLEVLPLPDPAEFAIRGRGQWGEVTPDIAEQLFCYRRAEKKLADFHQKGWLYRRLSLEQCSGAAAARYKAGLFSGKLCADLTGGLGIDSLAFSAFFGEVHHVEAVPEISALARHNHRVSGAGNIRHYTETAADFMHRFQGKADLMYADPSRRDGDARVFRLADCEPDIPELLPLLREKAQHVLLKLSPIYDLKQLIRELPEIQFIEVVSHRGEVKEILAGWRNEPGMSPERSTKIAAVLIDDAGNVLHRAEQSPGVTQPTQVSGDALLSGDFLLLPDPAVVKAGVTAAVARHLSLSSLSGDGSLLWARKGARENAGFYPERFPGRSFVLDWCHPFHPKQLKKKFREAGLKRVHVYRRSFPSDVAALRKTFQLEMGEDGHLIFFTDATGQRWCALCSLC